MNQIDVAVGAALGEPRVLGAAFGADPVLQIAGHVAALLWALDGQLRDRQRWNRDSRAGSPTWRQYSVVEALPADSLRLEVLGVFAPGAEVFRRIELDDAGPLAVLGREDLVGDESGHRFDQHHHLGRELPETHRRARREAGNETMRLPWVQTSLPGFRLRSISAAEGTTRTSDGPSRMMSVLGQSRRRRSVVCVAMDNPIAVDKPMQNEPIDYCVRSCSLGELLVAGTRRGVCFVRFGTQDAALRKLLAREFPFGEFARSRRGRVLAWSDRIVAVRGRAERRCRRAVGREGEPLPEACMGRAPPDSARADPRLLGNRRRHRKAASGPSGGARLCHESGTGRHTPATA